MKHFHPLYQIFIALALLGILLMAIYGCAARDPYTKGNHRTIDKVIYTKTFGYVPHPNNPKGHP